MGWFVEALDKWVTSFLVEITAKLLSMLAYIMNAITGSAIDSLKLMPKEWNEELYTLVKNVHGNVIVPLAVLVLAFLMTKELIDSFLEHNNMKTMQDEYLFKWLFRIIIALFFISKSFEIINGILILSKIFINNTHLKQENIDFAIKNIDEWKKQVANNLSTGTAFILMLGTTICSVLSITKLIKILIAVFKRMFDMLFLLCFGAIPMSLITSSKYESQTWNFLRKVFAVCLQVAIFLLLIKMLNVVWNSFILTDFTKAEITYQGIILSLLKMVAYISCISLAFDKVEDISEQFLGIRG